MNYLEDTKAVIKKLRQIIDTNSGNPEKIKEEFEKIPEVQMLLQGPEYLLEFGKMILGKNPTNEEIVEQFNSFEQKDKETCLALLELLEMMISVEGEDTRRLKEVISFLSQHK